MKHKDHSLGFIIPERKFQVKSSEISIHLKRRPGSDRHKDDRQSLPIEKKKEISPPIRRYKTHKHVNSKSEDKTYVRNREQPISRFRLRRDDEVRISGRLTRI